MKSLKSILAIFLFTLTHALAQPGNNDFSFNSNDAGRDRGSLVTGTVHTSCVLSDGRIVIGGNFTGVNGTVRNNIACLNPNGTLDTTFNLFYSSGGAYTAKTCILQPDGKILMAINQNSSSNSELIRINPDGTLENVLNNTNGDIQSISLQSDGKIIIGGEFSMVGIDSQNKIARLNNNGSLDYSFTQGTGIFGTVLSTVIQNDGKVIIAGNFSTYNGQAANDIARLNTDGTLDLSFNSGTGVNSFIYSLGIQTDGKIVIGGNFTSVDGYTINRIARLNADGSRDTAFNPGSGIDQNSVWKIQFQQNGKILVGGNFTTVNGVLKNGIVRLEVDGSIDTTFLVALPNTAFVYTINIDQNGDLMLGGTFSTVNGIPFNKIVKVRESGQLDDLFNSGTGATNGVNTLSLQPDGKILVGGVFYSINSSYRTSLTRMNADGSLDTTFNTGTGAFLNVSSSAVQSDGKIVIGGNFTSFNGVSVNRIARVDTNGFFDSTFNCGIGADNIISTISIQNDGKILIGGEFLTINNVSSPRIARLNSDGSLDATFAINSGFNDYLTSIRVQSDGKILAAGNFTTYNGNPVNRIIRLNSDGSQDLTFNIGAGANDIVNNIELQPDGKILVGGKFTTFDGNSRKAIVRLNVDGTIDQSFTSLNFSGTVNAVYSSQVASNGQIIIGGLFSNINGISRKNIARLNSDGTLDLNFDPGSGANSSITNLFIQGDGRILISGIFTTYNGVKRNRIARLLDCFPYTDTSHIINCGSYYWNVTGLIYSNSGIYYDSMLTTNGCDSILILDLSIYTQQSIVFSNFSLPSSNTLCNGEVAITTSGNAPFNLDFDAGTTQLTSNGYSIVNNLCPGVHDLHITDFCGDTLLTQIVIPIDSNYVFNNPFLDSLAQDSLGVTMTNCDIYYNGIDTAYIDSIWANGNTVNVIWNIVDSNGSNFDTTSYVLNNGNGVYWLQLSVFCPNKALGDYFAVTEAIYFNNGSVSTAGLGENELNNIGLFPNPTSEIVTISMNAPSANLRIHDIQGKLVAEQHVVSGSEISLKEFETGVYLFEVISEGNRTVKRVVKN